MFAIFLLEKNSYTFVETKRLVVILSSLSFSFFSQISCLSVPVIIPRLYRPHRSRSLTRSRSLPHAYPLKNIATPRL